MLAEIVNKQECNIAFMIDYIQIIESFKWNIDEKIYKFRIQQTHQSLLKIPEIISDEELKNSTKD